MRGTPTAIEHCETLPDTYPEKAERMIKAIREEMGKK